MSEQAVQHFWASLCSIGTMSSKTSKSPISSFLSIGAKVMLLLLFAK